MNTPTIPRGVTLTHSLFRLVLLGILWLTYPASAANRFLPYTGLVTGAVLCDATLRVQDASAWTESPQHGEGPQEFQDFGMQIWEKGGVTHLSTEGIGVTTLPTGERLRIRFSLVGAFNASGTVNYRGQYEVLPGGTGRFEFANVRGNLGKGRIEGTATVGPDAATGLLAFRFEHEFDGTLLSVGSKPKLTNRSPD